MGIITLEGMKFHGYHGVHESERKNGNLFEVDLEIEYDFEKAASSDDLSYTLDYEKAYLIVKQQMEGSNLLLEHLAKKIIDALYSSHPGIEHATVKVSKMNPPVGGDCERASVRLSR